MDLFMHFLLYLGHPDEENLFEEISDIDLLIQTYFHIVTLNYG